jgi:hypothetical protein
MIQRDKSPPAFSVGKGARGTVVRKDRDLANVGPFNYNSTFADKKREASYSMGEKLGSSLINKNDFSPSPNIYNPSTVLSKIHAPEFKIGTSKREPTYDARNAKLVPAPCAYEIKSKAFENLEKPKFHIG